MIRLFTASDLPGVISVWNEAVEAKEVVYYPLTEAYFHKKFEQDPNYDPKYTFVAEEDGKIAGFINGVAKKVFLGGETNENTPGFLTCVFVGKEYRGRGIGRALVETLGEAFKANGKSTFAVNGNNPINLDWIVPGTPGHDHNNAPGVDVDCPGFAFLKKLGFNDLHTEVAMYLNLSEYKPWDELKSRQEALRAQGIETGRYDASLGYDYDTMCDGVESEYWRSVLKTEIQCHRDGVPCTDIRFIPNGIVPAGPRPILAATHEGKIVAFTGPVDKQMSGRGWFSGICTDPNYERRGIASVLFNLLMQEFVDEGAAFSTLFTGDDNHAQKIYKNAGLRVVKRFSIMKKAL
ncbi:MAG: GNAT family N-acetyltransferase [Clostridia bacterium]|nr:GNAT family N-acetyltransferase [Clostridia bacterium]MBR6561804.1 GNAT family N-acetyltransferase [Oscillospiraceae bacterium]